MAKKIRSKPLHLTRANRESQKKLATEFIAKARSQRAKVLNLREFNLDQLPQIGGWPALRQLDIGNNWVVDISAVKELIGLRILGLTSARITDLSPIKRLTNLKELFLGHTRIQDITPLSNLRNLEGVYLHSTRVTDLAPLKRLPRLKVLTISSPKISDLSPLANHKRLQRLDLSGSTKISDISVVSKFSSLRDISLSRTRVAELSPLKKLDALEEVDISGTRINTLAPLAGARKIKTLRLVKTPVNDLLPIVEMRGLSSLEIDRTKIVDLSPLIGKNRLSHLSLSNTNTSDLSPLRKMRSLRRLNLSGTPVVNLEALAGLTKLQRLDIRGTKAVDLLPLAHLTNLVQFADSEDWFGLNFSARPMMDATLASFSRLPNPDRTILTINYLREQLGLPPVIKKTDGEPNAVAPPAVPSPGPGPHFVVREDVIVDFAPPEALDKDGNNLAHLRVLHPVLRELSRSLVGALQSGNLPHANLLDKAAAYRELVDRELEDVPFSRLYIEGVMLQSALESARTKISERELPTFDVNVESALGSLLAMHGTFMLSTADGLALILAEERFHRSREEKLQIQQAALDFSIALTSRPDLVAPAAAEFIRGSAEVAGVGSNPDRSTVITSAMTTNVALVLVTGATVGALAVAAGALTGPVGGAVATLVGYEAVKRSKSFQAVTGVVTRGIDKLPEIEAAQQLSERTKRLIPYAEFVVRIEPILRRFAKGRSQFSWLNESLDWLKRHGRAGEQ